MSQLPEVDFWFDFASTYSYPAAMRIEEAAGRYGSMVHWRPFLLGPIFKEQGWNDSPFNIYPAKGRYMWRDLERLCAALQIPFRKPTEFPRRSLLATRIACAGQEADWIAEFARRVYTANFAEDLDVAKPAVLLRCLDGLVEDPASMLAAAGDKARRLECGGPLSVLWNWASSARRRLLRAASCFGATIGLRQRWSGADPAPNK